MALEEIEIDGQSFFIPSREGGPTHRCMCVIVRNTYPPEDQIDRCGVNGLAPDVPFCENCEDRHQNQQLSDAVTITVWTYEMKERSEHPDPED